MINEFRKNLKSDNVGCFTIYESRRGEVKNRFLLRLGGSLYFVERMGQGKSNSCPPKIKALGGNYNVR